MSLGLKSYVIVPNRRILLTSVEPRRSETAIARIQFALAGINAHINHDLPIAIVNSRVAPQDGDVHYNDYTALNTTLIVLWRAQSERCTYGCWAMRCPGDPPERYDRCLQCACSAWGSVEQRGVAVGISRAASGCKRTARWPGGDDDSDWQDSAGAGAVRGSGYGRLMTDQYVSAKPRSPS